MPNKPLSKLWPSDRMLRKLANTGPDALMGAQVELHFVHGFELFNTTSYHNYETFSNGWRLYDHQYGIVIAKEDLDEALEEWENLRLEFRSLRTRQPEIHNAFYRKEGDPPWPKPYKVPSRVRSEISEMLVSPSSAT